MPTKVKGRLRYRGRRRFACRRPDKRMWLRNACLSRSRGVENGTPKSKRSYGRIGCTAWVRHACKLSTVRCNAQQVHRAETTAHRAVAVGVFDSRVLQPTPRLLLVCGHCS